MSNKRILVVEDRQDNITLIMDILESLGYQVLHAWDGETGVRLTREEQPDLILMDLSLPEMDGWTATSHLKADDTTQQIPIIALTAHAMLGDRERALEAGCDDFISKPINFRELAQKLQEYLT